jgi:16S rRNA (uracil1498-N3)-methyltransferase
VPLFYQPGIPDGIMTLSPDDSRHAAKVLRLTTDDIVEITDGKGSLYQARIATPSLAACSFVIQDQKKLPRRNFDIHIAIAPTKNLDRMEWFVEKAVELGVERISFVACQNSERRTINSERIQKIAVSALKQSQQVWMPELSPVLKFPEVMLLPADQKFIAHVDPQNRVHLQHRAKPGKRYLLLIGPEGDFSPGELKAAADHGIERVSLGPSRLRTETAGLAACHILNLVNS